MDSQALQCCHLLLRSEGRRGLLLGAGEQQQGGPGHQLDFLSFDKTSMVFPPYVYKKTHFLHNLVKYFKVLNQFFLKELSNFKRLFS